MFTSPQQYTHPQTNDIYYGYRDLPVGTREQRQPVLASPRLSAAPNPFNPSTTLRYTVPSPGRVRIDIFDVRGAHLRTLLDRHHTAGPHAIGWDGRTDSGAGMSSGIYFVRLETPSGTVTRRAVLLK